MATLDDILHGQDDAQKGTKEWSEQQSAGNVAVPVVPAAPVKQNTQQGTPYTERPTSYNQEKEGGYEWLYKQVNPYREPTAEELEKERKKQKREQIFAAIGDGISALSNLYFTTQGAPSMYNGKDTYSQRTKVRYDKLMKDREDNRTAYINGLMKARQADEAVAKEQREWKRLLQLDEEKRSAAKAKQEYDAVMHNLNVLLKQGQIDEQRYKKEKAKVEAGRANEVQNSIIAKNNASARGEFMAYDSDGIVHRFRSKDAAEAFARQNGTWEDITSSSTVSREEDDGSRSKKNTTTTTTKVTSGRSVKPVKGSIARKSNTIDITD